MFFSINIDKGINSKVGGDMVHGAGISDVGWPQHNQKTRPEKTYNTRPLLLSRPNFLDIVFLIGFNYLF